jgi:hypothetical protein
MKRTLLHEKYPIFVAEIAKTETRYPTVDALVEHYKARIAENPKVKFIGVFDHYAHTRSLGGDIAPGIEAAVDVIFCFGFALPSAQMLAVRPRSIGIADMGDTFIVSFMEAPMQPANQAMEAWTLGLRNIHLDPS